MCPFSSGSVVKVLAEVQNDKPTNRFNDAKCDSSGRLWCGTMGCEASPAVLQPKQGFLYSYSAGQSGMYACMHKSLPFVMAGGECPTSNPGVVFFLDPTRELMIHPFLIAGLIKEHVVTTLSNGLDWNRDDNIMYYIDTLANSVYTFTYNRETGSLSDQKVLIDYTQDADLAHPDGMCRDVKGRLWVASFGGQRVTCWDPESKERVLTLKIPGAKRITSCCFGGPNYEWLFVTSATYGASEEELAEYPNSGALFVVKDLGVCGTPAYKFKLN